MIAVPVESEIRTAATVAPVVRQISLNGTGFLVNFSYDAALVSRVKSVRGARWNPDRKVWSVPFDASEALQNSFSDFS